MVFLPAQRHTQTFPFGPLWSCAVLSEGSPPFPPILLCEDIKMFIYRPSRGACILKFNLPSLGWNGKKRKLEVFIYLGYVARQREIASFLLIFLAYKTKSNIWICKTSSERIHLTDFNKRVFAGMETKIPGTEDVSRSNKNDFKTNTRRPLKTLWARKNMALMEWKRTPRTAVIKALLHARAHLEVKIAFCRGKTIK